MYPGHRKCIIRGAPPTQNVLVQPGVVGCGEVYLSFFSRPFRKNCVFMIQLCILIAMVCTWSYVCACMLRHFSHVPLLATSWTLAHEAPLSLGFSRQEHWSGLPFPSPMENSMKILQIKNRTTTGTSNSTSRNLS